MVEDVPLIEESGAATAPDPEPDAPVATGGQRRPRRRDGFDVAAGGPGGEPVVRIPTSGGSIELGHEDIFLALLALDLAARLFKLWMEARK